MVDRDTERSWRLELEESAQGTDLFEAPGAQSQTEIARDDAIEARAGQTGSPRVEKARSRRASLGDVMTSLEAAVAKPAFAKGWEDDVASCVHALRAAFDDHVAVTEGPGGLLEEIIDVAPRLESEVEIIVAEHRSLEDSLLNLEEAVSLVRSPLHVQPERIRKRSLVVLGRLAVHRQRGADVVYEAYNVDIATAD